MIVVSNRTHGMINEAGGATVGYTFCLANVTIRGGSTYGQPLSTASEAGKAGWTSCGHFHWVLAGLFHGGGGTSVQ